MVAFISTWFSFSVAHAIWQQTIIIYIYATLKEFHKRSIYVTKSLQWRNNVNHWRHDCLLNRLFRRRSKKTSKLRVTGLCAGNYRWPVNSPNAENVSFWWRHHVTEVWGYSPTTRIPVSTIPEFASCWSKLSYCGWTKRFSWKQVMHWTHTLSSVIRNLLVKRIQPDFSYLHLIPQSLWLRWSRHATLSLYQRVKVIPLLWFMLIMMLRIHFLFLPVSVNEMVFHKLCLLYT